MTNVVIKKYKFWGGTWKQVWKLISTSLCNIKSDIIPWMTRIHPSHREDVNLNRLRIGHRVLTHKYILDRKDAPLCCYCGQQPITVVHIIYECPVLQIYHTNPPSSFFSTIPVDRSSEISQT